MDNIKSIIVLLFFWLAAGCTSSEIQKEVSLINQAESLLQSDPHQAHALLDSVKYPEELSMKQGARWCMLVGKLADSISTPLPYTYQLNQADKYFQRHGSPTEQAQVKLYLGRAYMDDSNPEKAMQLYCDALELALSDSAFNLAGYVSSYMADLYEYQNSYLLALWKYYDAAMFFNKTNNKKSEAYAYFDMGKQYAFTDSLDMALANMSHADSLMLAVGDSIDIAVIYNGYGNIFFLRNNYGKAEYYLKKSIQYNPKTSAPCYSVLSRVYFNKEEYDVARMYLDYSQKSKSNNPNTHIDNLYKYSMLESEEGNYRKAYEYMKHYVDTLRMDLQRKNELRLLEVEKKYNHTKATLENIHLKKLKARIFAGIVFLILVLIIIVAVFFLLLNRKKIELLTTQKYISDMDEELTTNKVRMKKLLAEIDEEKQKNVDLDSKIKLLAENEKNVERLNALLVEKRKQLLESAPILKKMQKLAGKNIPQQTQSPLNAIDWQNIIALIDMAYPKIFRIISSSRLSEEEGKLCYLSILGFSTADISLLLYTPKSTLYKNRQRAKAKLQIPNNYASLEEYFADLT